MAQFTRIPPRSLFAVVASGAFIATGIYTMKIAAEGMAAEYVVKIILFGITGIVMQWGASSKR